MLEMLATIYLGMIPCTDHHMFGLVVLRQLEFDFICTMLRTHIKYPKNDVGYRRLPALWSHIPIRCESIVGPNIIYIYYMYIANHYKLVESSGERLMRKQCSAELSSLGHSSIRT